MEPVEYDVYVSSRADAGGDPGAAIAAGLRRRGFRVAVRAVDGGGQTGDLETLIDSAQDFVLVLTPRALDGCRDAADPMRREIALAIDAERNIVPVVMPGYVAPPSDTLPPEIAGFARRDAVVFSPRSEVESIARIAHRLSSDAAIDERRELRQAKWIASFAGVVLLAVIAVGVLTFVTRMFAPRIDERPLPPMVLSWAAFGQRTDAGRAAELVVADGGALRGGDRMRLLFSTGADGYAYVVSRDTRGEITVLFPTRGVKGASRVQARRVYQAPVDGSWVSVDDATRVEALYLVASYDPIENLESLLEERAEEAAPEARQALLESTVTGLLDGRHAGVAGRVRSRSGRPIAESADAGVQAASASTTLDDGRTVTRKLTQQPGLVSAMVELHFKQ